MQQRIIALLLLLILAAGGAFWLLLPTSDGPATSDRLFPEINKHAQDILEVAFESSEGLLFGAKRTNQGWQATHLNGVNTYPIDEQYLAEFVTAVTQANLREPKTRKPEYYSRLGVSDIAVGDSKATLVTVFAGAHQWQLLIGNQASGGTGSYVRKPGETQSWLLDRTLTLPMGETDWLKQPILDIDVDDITQVTRAGDTSWRINKSDDDSWSLADLPEGREIRYDGVIESFVSNLVSMRFDSIGEIEQGQEADSETDIADQDQAPGRVLARLQLQSNQYGPIDLVLEGSEDSPVVTLNAVESPSNLPHWHGISYGVSKFVAGQINKSSEDFLAEQQSEPQSGPTAIDEGEAPQ